MKRTILIIASLSIVLQIYGQSPIVLQEEGNIFVHSRLDTIIARASDGAAIYLPGGNVVLNGDLIINNKVNIYGAGHYPDSTVATGPTFISGGNLKLSQGASGSTLTGFYLYNDIYVTATATDTVSFVDISRCNISNLYLGYSSSSRNINSQNIRISGNVIRGRINGGDAQYCLIENNIIDGQLSFFNGNASFLNNIFAYTYSYSDVFSSCSGLVVNNSIFRDYHGLGASQLSNNIFTVNMGDAPGGTNIGSGNIGNQLLEDIFNAYTGGTFNYDYDYTLKSGSIAINNGTDGTDIGISGGSSPYKKSAVPINPHIRMVVIPSESVNGTLPVRIDVSAQQK